MSTGIDIAWDRPSIAEIKATGAVWVARYFSPDPTKNLHASEVTSYQAAGLGIVTVWEGAATRALDGRAAGVSDAQAAVAQNRGVGLPDTTVIHFAVDTDTDWASVAPYFDGVISVLGLDRVGTYGGLRVIEGAHSRGIKYLWQTVAWSGGVWSQWATIRQPIGTTLNGQADYDNSMVADFGQFPRPTAVTPPATLTIGDENMASGQLAAGFGADSKGNITHPELAALVSLGGKNSGAVGGTWLMLYCDFGTARVRVAIHGPKGWDIRMIDLDNTKGAVWVPNIADGATHASIVRVDRGTATAPDKSANLPIGWGTVAEIK